MFAALNRSQALVEFALDGTILSANENFCTTMGYSLEEIRGRHHSMFVDAAHAKSAEYRALWARLGRGEHDAGQYQRLGKGGRQIWIQASYNPVLDARGMPCKVVKFATDITAARLRAADQEGQLAAVSKVQAVAEFGLDGTVLTANENFCKVVGYTLEEIRGKHHSMFADPACAQSAEYRALWAKLARGRVRLRPVPAPGQGRPGDLDPGFLQPDPRHERQAVQGRQVRHRHHHAAQYRPPERRLQGRAGQCFGQRRGGGHGLQHHLPE